MVFVTAKEQVGSFSEAIQSEAGGVFEVWERFEYSLQVDGILVFSEDSIPFDVLVPLASRSISMPRD